MKLTGAQALIKSLEMEGVEVMFGLPGGAILPVYDPLIDSSIRHILVRHEQGAGHMASGYAHATGRPGVAMVTSGPAATNIVTPLCDAYMDSVPFVCITGQVPYRVIGTDAFQEADTVGITMPVTKHNWLVSDAQDIPRVVREAFHVVDDRPARSRARRLPEGRRQRADGLVLAREDRPARLQAERQGPPEADQGSGAAHAATRANRSSTRAVASSRRARRQQLRELAELTGMPVVTTLMARGALPDEHPLCLGMPGMHGNYTAITSLQKADLLVTLGARFDDRVTGNPATFAPNAKVIHVDIDPAELGKVRRPDVPIVGDCQESSSSSSSRRCGVSTRSTERPTSPSGIAHVARLAGAASRSSTSRKKAAR